MKKTLSTLLSVLFCAISFAQSVPQGINYQAVARDASGDVLMNQALMIQFSVISDITTSAVSWQETHQVTTNDYGLYTAIIGGGTSTNVGTSVTFDVIDWGASNHLLKVEVDFGSGYLDMGTTAFMSVPYSIYSKNLIGCTDSTALNYSTLANTDDGSCIAGVNGCTNPTAFNYNASANTDDGSCRYTPLIGDTYGGGIIFWLNGYGGGLIAAASDQSIGAEWGCLSTAISGADGTAIGTGNQNTIDIEAGCTTPGTAADICANLTFAGYNDWFLPSKDELNEMFLNIGQGNALGLGNIGGFANNSYWSSTEYDSFNAWLQYFFYGLQFNDSKNGYDYVRAVRAF